MAKGEDKKRERKKAPLLSKDEKRKRKSAKRG